MSSVQGKDDIIAIAASKLLHVKKTIGKGKLESEIVMRIHLSFL